jgi:hypothetical protein
MRTCIVAALFIAAITMLLTPLVGGVVLLIRHLRNRK